MELILACLATGALAGLTAGLFGVGGGLIIVPSLALLLPRLGIGESTVMQIAIGTSLAVISATAVSSTWAHHRRGGIRWPVFATLTPGLVIGALLGAALAHRLDGNTLRLAVGVGALLVATKMAFGGSPAEHDRNPAAALLLPAGGVIGSLSALIGIGGGSLTVPLLSFSGVPMRQAVGTSAACGMPIAWAGMAGMVIAGWGLPGLPAGNLGYVSVPGFVAIAGTSVLLAPLGARLAHALPQAQLKRGFALLLLLIGVRMLWSGLAPV